MIPERNSAGTQILLIRPAEFTIPAGYHHTDSDPISDPETGNSVSNGGHGPGALMTDWMPLADIPRFFPGKNTHIRATDGCGMNLDQHFPRPRLGTRHIAQDLPTRFFKNQSFHNLFFAHACYGSVDQAVRK
jgi:hypothetical protein